MTRINLIPVELLIDAHLLAEYREITRISSLARKDSTAPGHYTLGTGHVKFFYDKGMWLYERTEQLYAECVNRGFIILRKTYLLHPDGLNSGWIPSDKALSENIYRLHDRCYGMKRQPTMRGNRVPRDYYYQTFMKDGA